MAAIGLLSGAALASALWPLVPASRSVNRGLHHWDTRMRFAIFVFLVAQAFAAGWPYYGGDAGGTKYSPLAGIDRSNVKSLRPAWIFDSGDFSDGSKFPNRSAFEATPLVADGVLYITTPFHRLFALDAETGRQLWMFDPKFDPNTRVNLFTDRGVALWRSGGRKRLFLGDQQGRLFSIDAATGRPDPAFANDGVIDLKQGMIDPDHTGSYGLTSPAAVCGDVVVTGSWVSDNEPRGPSGDVRGFDVRTGKPLWRFHTVPRSGEFGNDTWAGDSWKGRGGANVWSMMTVDEKRGMVFLPLTSPSTDYYGGDRKGANLFGDSVVALDCRTGRRRWHFQTVHHNIWDYDLPSQPVLVTVTRAGRKVDAVAQATKTGFVFLLDRETGRPLFPVEERPVPPSAVPGEETWPTQPFPLQPPPFARQSMSASELTSVTPESRAECLAMVRDAVLDTGLFYPQSEKWTALFPGTNGGSNWGGGSFDPETGTLYVNSMDVGSLSRMVKREGAVPYRSQSTGRFWDSNGYPCQKPPWGSLTAIDLNRGEIRWRAVLGEFPELAKRGVPKTGTPNLGGSLVTAGGLVFIAATNDSRFRAFDKDTGAELWSAQLPASGHATPMTYTGPRSGRQFVAIAAGGGNKYNRTYSGRLVVFALPRKGDPAVPRLETAAPAVMTRLAYRGVTEKLPVPVAPQPVPFSHRVHLGQARLNCRDCHVSATSGEKAGLPDAARCMLCHRSIRADAPSIAALRQFHGDIAWVRVYRLPDFVFFSHQRHAAARVDCSTCHGAVSERDVLAKEVSTGMQTCYGCHVKTKASIVCDVCHRLGQ